MAKLDSTKIYGNLDVARDLDVKGNATKSGVQIATINDNVASATKLQTARTFTIAGDATGSANFDGTANATITVTIVDDSHNHIISNVDGLQTALDGKSDNHAHPYRADTWLPTLAEIGAEPVFSKNTAFNKALGTTAGTVAEGNHTHDSRYYTESETDALLDTKSGVGHVHVVTWNDVTGTPETFTPAAHDHDDVYYLKSLADSKFVDVAGDAMTGQLSVSRGGTTIGGTNLANAWLLSGTTTEGIGIDNNEIIKLGGTLYFGTGDSNIIELKVGNAAKAQVKADGLYELNSRVWTAATFDPATKLGVSAKAADSELLDGLDSSQFLRSDTDDTFTGSTLTLNGTTRVNTNGGVTGLYIQRSAGTSNEYTKHYVDDAVYNIHYKNDESENHMKFTLENTDTESGGGASANSGYILFSQSSSETILKVNENKVYHEGFKPTSADTNSISATLASGYYGIGKPDGTTTDWIRTTANGIIPYAPGGASALGTSSWPFNTIHGNNIYDNGTLLANKYLGISAKAADSNLLDGINSTQFVRNDTSNTLSGDLTITKADPTLRLFDDNTATGNYPRILFDTTNNQGVMIRHTEFDGEIPGSGPFALVIERSPNNLQTSNKTKLIVEGEIYADGTQQVYHPGNKPSPAALGAIPTTEKGVANGVATLDSGGKLPVSQLPSIALNDTFVVASQAAMLALTAQTGDVAIRTDISTTFILKGSSASTLADWEELISPLDGVTSVTAGTGLTGGTITSTGTLAIDFGTGTNQAARGDHNHDSAYLGISAKAADSDKLDGLDGGQFLRSDVDDNWGGTLYNSAAGKGISWNQYGTSGIFNGNGDQANYTTHNVKFKGWWGMGMYDHTDTVRGYYDFRTGKWDTLGGFYKNGVEMYHPGNKPTPSDVGALATTGGTLTGTLTIDCSTFNTMQLYTEEGTAQIADTFVDTTTYKSYIFFNVGQNSNDPGYIMHETSDTETNEGVLHLCPSDDNAYGDYVSIHGTDDADVIKLHTSGVIEGVTDLKAVTVFENGTTLSSKYLGISAKASDSNLLDGLDSSAFLRSNANDDFTGTLNYTNATGTILSFSGTPALTRHGGLNSKSLGLGADDTLFLGAGESRNIMASNITDGRETVEIGADTSVNIHVSPDNWASWGTRKTLSVTYADIQWDGNSIYHASHHPLADKLTTARTISLGGDLSGSASFDGSANITINASVADDSHNHTNYLPLAGGTVSGQLLLSKNGAGDNIKIGDDAWIGDINQPNTIGIKGVQNSGYGYVRFGSDSNNLGYNGSKLVYGSNEVYHKGNKPTPAEIGAIISFITVNKPSHGITALTGMSYSAAGGWEVVDLANDKFVEGLAYPIDSNNLKIFLDGTIDISEVGGAILDENSQAVADGEEYHMSQTNNGKFTTAEYDSGYEDLAFIVIGDKIRLLVEKDPLDIDEGIADTNTPNTVLAYNDQAVLTTEARGTAFNKAFGTTEDTVAEGNHTHNTIGNALSVGGQLTVSTGGANVTGNTTVTGNMTATGIVSGASASITGNITGNAVTAGTLTSTGGASVAGDVSANTLTLNGWTLSIV